MKFVQFNDAPCAASKYSFRPTRYAAVAFLLFLLSFTPHLAIAAQSQAPNIKQADALMDKAIRYFGLLTAREIKSGDAAWLRDQWRKDLAEAPMFLLAELDPLAFGLELVERGDDPRRLAALRSQTLDSIYCAAEKTSDPVTQRFKAIIAPEDIVLASDCRMGFVITTFDIEGLVASNALTAQIIGKTYDPQADKKAIKDEVRNKLSEFNEGQKSFLAQAEMRNAILQQFWTLIGEHEKQALTAELTRQAAKASHIGDAARNLETLAQQKIGQVDFLARSGKFTLSAGELGKYFEWVQRIAGYNFSARDRFWIQQSTADEFRAEPAKLKENLKNIDVANRNYILEKDANKKMAMLKGWTAYIYCHLSASSDPDDQRSLEIVFRYDPVVESDCANNQVTRKSGTVLAEADGHVLREGDIGELAEFLGMLLGRAPTDRELAILRKRKSRNLKSKPAEWRSSFDSIRGIVPKYRNNYHNYLKNEFRLKTFTQFYCVFKKSSSNGSKKYLEMLQDAHKILYEDCERNVVVTERAAKTLLAEMNFVAWLAGVPILTQAEEAELLKQWTEYYRSPKQEVSNILAEAWSAGFAAMVVMARAAEAARSPRRPEQRKHQPRNRYPKSARQIC